MEINQLYEAIAQEGSQRAAARALGMPESTLRLHLKRAASAPDTAPPVQLPLEFRSYRSPKPVVFEPLSDRPRYFILSSAQDGSEVHESFLQSLKIYAEWLENCEIIISGFTYNKALFEDHDKRSEGVYYAASIDDYIVHDRINIGPKLVFCGEMNTLPTAVQPLSGFESYTRDKWGIFPHVKVQLKSIPTAKNALSKQIMTTGAVTLPNYVRKKAGIKATFHHVVGAVLVELLPNGTFFCRHLLADSLDDGSFYDLDRLITPEGVTQGHRVEALTYGDIHHEKLDLEVSMATWGYIPSARKRLKGIQQRYRPEMDNEGSYIFDESTYVGSFTPLIDYLRPNFEFYHDLSDFAPRNHHNIKDHHFRFKTHAHGTANVKSALLGCASFLSEVVRDDCMAVVVESNHDQALVKWLKTADYRDDPENATFFLEMQASYYRYLSAGNDNPPVFEDFLRENGVPSDVVFVNEDSSFVICGDIECAMHGHLGANGAKASPAAFTRMGMKSNTGHTHSPSITDGAYIGGVSGKMDMGYNRGLSSWAHAHICTYPNGKRTILTMMGGGFFADQIGERWMEAA